jgi:hypothetical protein
MDFHSLEKLALKRNPAGLVFNERSFNEDISLNSNQKVMRSTSSSFYRIKPNKINPTTIYGNFHTNNVKEMCHGK